jgi:hypothetical protein
MSAASETPVTERQILLLGPYGVPGAIDAVAENPKWGIATAARRPAPTYRAQAAPPHITPDQIAKTEAIRQKMLRLALEKYLFRVQDRTISMGLLIEDKRLVGSKVAAPRVESRKAEPLASEYELRPPMVISSIGSVPEETPGVAMNGEYYDFNKESLPRYGRSDHVFGVGNVLTGQGNIHSLLLHSRESLPNSSKTISASVSAVQCLRAFTRVLKPRELRKRRLFGIEFMPSRVSHTSKLQRSSNGFTSFKNEQATPVIMTPGLPV